ncbi:MAG: phosphocholine cytidylyltransferase family protein [Rhodanobacteraceae bacterium]
MTAAIVLAAGRGSRLERYTHHLPKALVRVGGRSLLDWNLRALEAAGVASVTVVAGYRAERLARPGVEIVISRTWESEGPLASLLAARPSRMDRPFLVVYGDCVHHPDNLRCMLERDADIAVAGDRAWRALWNERHEEPLLDAETYRHRNGSLVSIGARPSCEADIAAQFAGLLRFAPAGWRRVEQTLAESSMNPFDMTSLLARLLDRNVAIADVPIHGRWAEIDSALDLRLCRSRLHASSTWLHDWRATDGDARCG